MPESITCRSCGRTIDGGMSACPSCGSAIELRAEAISPSTSSNGLPSWPAPYPSKNDSGGYVSSNYSGMVDGGPESDFGAPLARWSQRFGSMLLDLLILVVPYLVLSALCTSAFGHYAYVKVGAKTIHTKILSVGASDALRLLFVAAWAIYMTVMNGIRSQTPGNRALKIEVRDASTGEVLGPRRGFVRWLVRFVLYLVFVIPGLLNDLFPLWDRRRQTIADKFARSVVVRL